MIYYTDLLPDTLIEIPDNGRYVRPAALPAVRSRQVGHYGLKTLDLRDGAVTFADVRAFLEHPDHIHADNEAWRDGRYVCATCWGRNMLKVVRK